VPWRAVGAIAALLVVGAVLFVVLALPAINDSNESAADRQAAVDAQRKAARDKRIAATQRPHRAQSRPASDTADRHVLVGELEAAVLADARARVESGALETPVRRVDCEATPRSSPGGLAPEEDPDRGVGGYSCTAVTSDIAGHKGAAVGYPFQAVIDFQRGALVWCKTNPPPGEQVIPDPSKVVALPAACRDPGAGG
jgi:hypothetical protein